MHVVMFSSGVGSWATAKRVVARHGVDDTVLLFTDVKGSNPSDHAGEDPDNYRFLHEAAANVGAELVRVNTGRDIYDVFHDEHMLGNSRVAPCSRELKQKPAREWVEANCDPSDTTIYIGIDWSEEHRLEPNRRGWAPWHVEAPMTERPLLDKDMMLEWLRSEGIEPPCLYQQGFGHANCGGFCVRMGHGQAKHLLRTNRERFLYHEQREEEFRARFGVNAAFLRYRGGLREGQPLPLRELREQVERQPSLLDEVEDDESGCDACFTVYGEDG